MRHKIEQASQNNNQDKSQYIQSSNKAEYSVYVYHCLDEIEDGHADWEKMRVTGSKYRAYHWAERYHKTKEFRRVEVKCKLFDAQHACQIDRTVRVFQKDKALHSTTFLRSTNILHAVPQFLRKYL